MGTGSIWVVADVISASRMNLKTILVDTGSAINSASSAQGWFAYCTSTGSGFTADHVYVKDGSAWQEIAKLNLANTFSGAITSTGGITISVTGTVGLTHGNHGWFSSPTGLDARTMAIQDTASNTGTFFAFVPKGSPTDWGSLVYFAKTDIIANQTNYERMFIAADITNNKYRIVCEAGGTGLTRPLSFEAFTLYQFSAGIGINGSSTNNQIFNSSQGVGSTTLYIGNASINVTSDIRLKTDIHDYFGNATDIISKMRVVDFKWNDPSDKAEVNRNSRGKWVGLIAQEIIDLVPWVVNSPARNCEKCKNGKVCDEHETYWQVEFNHMVPLLCKSIQEMDKRLKAVEGRIK